MTARATAGGTGLDVGSTTVKVVVLAQGVVVHRASARHQGRGLEVARRLLAQAPGVEGPRVVTGSAGLALAEELGAAFIHEVPAVEAAVRHLHPATRTVVELGGQDAKLLTLLDGDCASDMNERCAAGTGAVLDRCVNRLGLGPDALERLVLPERLEVPLVSAKCGVFAEADLIGLVKAGRHPDEVLAGLLDAVVRGTLNALARGRPLTPGVLLLGGPHAFIPALATLWRRRLQERWASRGVGPGEVTVPEGAQFYAARGALLCDSALRQVARARRSARQTLQGPRADGPGAAPAATSPAGAPGSLPAAPRVAARGPLALGLDAGSTTVKGVLLDARGALAATAYRKATQDPFADARAVLQELATQLRGDGHVAAFGVTGYAADLLGPVLGADCVVVETLAHARAARHAVPDADVVCDVGGQDIKVLLLDAHGVRGFRLSQQCAAGNGALLEAAASDFGVPLEAAGPLALSATRRPTFSVGCAVFLDTERVTAQRDGFTPAEILAGLAHALPQNVWENVAAANDLPALGTVFVLSGGVQRNPAVVRAQVDYLAGRHPGARVVVHPCAGEAGAVGAALLALEGASAPTRFLGFDALARLRWETRADEALRCRSCLSACARVEVSALAPDGTTRRFLTGQGCERGDGAAPPPGGRAGSAAAGAARNLVLLEATRLFGRVCEVKPASRLGARLRVGLPRVLPMYRAAPLFTHYFEALGVPREQLVTGVATSEALWRQHGGRGTVDACYPAKVAQAHVAAMLSDPARELDVLFFPALTHALTAVVGCADTASCPVVAGTPLVTAAAFGADDAGRLAGGVRLLRPTLALCSHPQLSASLFAAVRSVLPGLSRAEHDAALVEGFKAQREFEAAMEALGAQVVDEALHARRAAVVMLGRPYHADPGLQHHLASELQALGRSTLSLRALPKRGAGAGEAVDCEAVNDLHEAAPSLTNSGDGEKLAAARFVASHPYLVAIEVSHFKCGQDASMYGAIAELARTGGRPFLALHDLDETRPVASLRLRLRTFLDAVERWERARAGAA